MRLYRRLRDRLWPPCPRGGHRVRGELIVTAEGAAYCWHPTCQFAVLAANRDCQHRWARIDTNHDGMISFQRCVTCGAHRVWESLPF